MAPKGEDGGWLRDGVKERKKGESVLKRQQGVVGGGESDGEGEDYGGCFPRGRRVYSDSVDLNGAPFARLATRHSADHAEISVKSKLVGAMCCCCCRQTRYAGSEGGVLETMSGNGKQGWEDGDVSGSATDCCKAPYWKQLARRAKAHVHVGQAHPPRADWLNYDPHSYQMNFDDGCRREDTGVSSLHIDETDDSASRERAMQTALLKKFAASRAQRGS